jgi:hypothetical protein
MRKLVILLITAVFWMQAQQVYSQMNRRQIKSNNKRLSSFRGKKFGFGKEKRYNTVGVSLNALNYYGDLAPKPNKVSTDISFTRPGIGFTFSHRFGPRYTLTMAFLYGTLKGSDNESADPYDTGNGIFRYNRNLSFRNRIQELSAVATFDLFENQSTYISRVIWTPYVYTGFAVLHHNPQAQVPAADLFGNPFSNAGEWVNLQPLGTEGQHLNQQPGQANYGVKPYKRIQPAIPIGIGARFRLNEVMDLSVEIGFRYVFTDYLDDVSGDYVFVGAFGADELTKALSYRSNELESVVPNLIGYTDNRYADTRAYNLLAGYGHENPGSTTDPGNERGHKKDKDIYTVTTFRFTYIIGKAFHRAKFR